MTRIWIGDRIIIFGSGITLGNNLPLMSYIYGAYCQCGKAEVNAEWENFPGGRSGTSYRLGGYF